MQNTIIKIILSLVVTGAIPAISSASNLSVDFGRSDQSSIEPGFSSGELVNQVSAVITTPVSLPVGTFGGVTVSLSSSNPDSIAGQDLRIRTINRGNTIVGYTGSQTNLFRDWVGTQAGYVTNATLGTESFGAAFNITLSGVTPGLHSWTSYHVDVGNGNSANQNGKMRIELSLDGGTSFSMLNPSFQLYSTGNNPNDPILNAGNPFNTSFTATGTDVIFRFRNVASGLTLINLPDGGEDFTIVNGFSLTQVPEPSTAALGLAGLALFFAVRSRRN